MQQKQTLFQIFRMLKHERKAEGFLPTRCPQLTFAPMNTKGKLQVCFKKSVVPTEPVLLRGIYKALALHWSFFVDKTSFNKKKRTCNSQRSPQTYPRTATSASMVK